LWHVGVDQAELAGVRQQLADEAQARPDRDRITHAGEIGRWRPFERVDHADADRVGGRHEHHRAFVTAIERVLRRQGGHRAAHQDHVVGIGPLAQQALADCDVIAHRA